MPHDHTKFKTDTIIATDFHCQVLAVSDGSEVVF